MNIIGIIPSRYGSSRFPGKPLAMIGDKPMVQWVYDNCKKGLEYVFVATDDKRIVEAVEAFGGRVVMTSEDHNSGTDRCAEAAKNIESKYGVKADVVINIQGDEPFFEPAQLNDIKSAFEKPDVQIATLIQHAKSLQQVLSQSEVKIALNHKGEAMYFSRSPIPFLKGVDQEDWLKQQTFYRHIGIYAYRMDTLNEIVKLEQSSLEIAESLEQLRWIENGIPVTCVITELDETMCIDTEEDLKRANELIKKM